MQKVILLGHIGNIEEAFTKNGELIFKFSLADNKTIKGEQKTTWHNVVCFRKLADIMKKHSFVGQQVFVEGEINYSVYEKNGEKRYYTNIVANSVNMITWNNDDKNQNNKQINTDSSTSFQNDDIPF